MIRVLSIASLALACGLAGCAARNAEMYRTDTRQLIETRTGAIQDCYNAELQKQSTAAGKVVVRFKVQNDTGKIVDAKVDAAQSSGSAALGECVVKAIDGLQLDPPDRRDGDATFSWEFQPKS